MPAVLPQLRVITPSREVTKIDAVDAPTLAGQQLYEILLTTTARNRQGFRCGFNPEAVSLAVLNGKAGRCV